MSDNQSSVPQLTAQELFKRLTELTEQVKAHPDYASIEWGIASEDRLIIPIGLLDAITERLDALERRIEEVRTEQTRIDHGILNRITVLEQSLQKLSRPPRTPPQPTIVVTYPEDLGE